MAQRTILHVDMDAFFASVEQHDHPELRGKPVVVGAPADARGVVSAASYEARAFGIHSAMPSREAARRCPHAIFVPINGTRYADVSRQVFGIFERFTPDVEPLSVDEALLDVTGVRHLFGRGPEIGQTIRETIRNETGITASVGVAHNKYLAKLASDLDKPDGLTVVPEGREAVIAFLAPLPVSRIWGVGKVTQTRLEEGNIHRIGDLQQLSEQGLGRLVGQHRARHLLRLAYGEDAREVEARAPEKSISREHTFGQDCTSPGTLRCTLIDLVEDVGRQLRSKELFAGVGQLKLRWTGFETITRQRHFAAPACDDFTLRELALSLFDNETLVKPVRLIGFGVSSLAARPETQLSLFDASGADSQREQLSRTIDTIREQYGRKSILRGGASELLDDAGA